LSTSSKRVDSRFGLLALAIFLGAGMADAQQQPAKPAGPPPPDLPGHVNYVAKQLYGVPLDESESITGQIQEVVLAHIQQWLSNHLSREAPSQVQVRRELESAFAQIQYPLYAWPAVFAQSWKGGTLYGVGYTLGWSDYDRANVIALFESRKNQVQLAAVTHFVPHTDLHYEFMMPPPSGNFWFVVYGTRLGKSQRRLTAELLSFDGQSLKSLWKIQDAYDGRISLAQNGVRIRYLKEDEYIRETARGRKPPRYESIYRVTPQGLELESTRELPF
jgi:hypothetical protein